jgi:hypothetical protein
MVHWANMEAVKARVWSQIDGTVRIFQHDSIPVYSPNGPLLPSANLNFTLRSTS